MIKAKIIGKIILSEAQRQELACLGVHDIATDNPKNKTDKDDIIRRIGDAEAVITNTYTPITKEVIAQCPHLKFIQTWSTGLDNIDIEAAQKADIIVKNVPDYSIESVAEKTISLMIFIANQMREANQDACLGHWDYTKFQGVELKGKVLGIFGKGKIGTRVAELAKAFGMSVQFTHSKTDQKNMLAVCAQSDFITLHCPLTKDTHHLLGKQAFNAMKKGVYLINNARGGIVDETALLDALEAGIVAYASMDVFEQEPPHKDNPLLNHPRVFVTPHIAWNTQEAVQKLTDQCIENLKKYFLSVNEKSLSTH